MSSLITLANQALAEIYKGQIASLDEGSLEAREAKRFAEPLLLEMAEWTEWPQLRARQALALIANDRGAEWLHCYALPNDFGHPVSVRRVETAATSLPIAGPYPFPMQDATPLPFMVDGNKLYTNVEAATLVYSRNTLTDTDLTPLMQRAFVLELASRIAGPLAKDAKLVSGKAQQAEYARQRAVAQQENVNPRHDQSYTSMAEYARAGIGV